ncbi:MAG: VirB8/TrbF family protein [Sneathiella sp.]
MARIKLFAKREEKSQTLLDRADHSAIRAADPFDFQVAHKRLAWTTRLLAGSLLASLVFNGILVNAISSLFPLKEIQIALLRADPADNRIYRVEPIAQDVPGFDLFMEMAVRNFTANVLKIDTVHAKPDIIATLDTFATREFNGKFYRQRAAAVDEAIEKGLNRSITIETAALLSNFRGVRNYSVDFIQTDKRDGKVIETRKLRAVLKVTTQPNSVKTKDKFNNPHGIRVMDMALKERPAL